MDDRSRLAPWFEHHTRTARSGRRAWLGLWFALALLVGSLGPRPMSAGPALVSPPAAAQPGGLQPLYFVENRGQFSPAPHMAGHGDSAEASANTPAPRFLVYGMPYGLWLGEDGLWLTLSEAVQATPDLSVASSAAPAPEPRATVHLHLTFPGSNPHPVLEPFDRLETHISYFLGSDPAAWRPDVPVWGGVRYRDLYDGLDLWVSAGGLRLVVRDEAAKEILPQVRLRIEGADSVTVLDGALRLTTAAGELPFPLLDVVGRTDYADVGRTVSPTVLGAGRANPPAYEIASPFAPAGAARPLAAPTARVLARAGSLIYSTYLGGATGPWGSDDDVHDVAVDASGNAYVTGYSRCSDFPTTAGVFSDTLASKSEDAFVAKLNASGSGLIYATFLGGTWEDRGYGIAVDGQGNAYVTGMTESPNWTPTSGGFPVTPGAFDESYSNGSEGFVTKLNPAGTALVYSSYLGAYSGDDNGWDITVDAAGNAYVAGDTYGGYPFEQYPGWDHTYAGSLDGFAVKVNPSGSALVFSTYLGGRDYDMALGIAVDASGAVYVTGRTSSADFPTTTAIGGNALGSTDAFLVKLNANGLSPAFSTRFGGNYYDRGTGVAVDASGAVYLTGETHSTNLPVTPGCFDPTPNGSADIFVAKITGTTVSYCTYFGGSGGEMDSRIALNAANEAFVAGVTFSLDLPVSPDAFDTTHGGGTCGAPPNTSPCADAFLLRLDSTGSTGLYATFLGGTGSDWLYGLAVDASSRAYLAGLTDSADFPVSVGAFDSTLGGTRDGFVSKMDAVGQPLGPTRTPSFTPTRSPTPTASPTPTPTPTTTQTPTPTATLVLPDLVADDLEVTQAVQDLNNSVRLVARKRTFVRFYVHSAFGEHSTYAQLRLDKDSDTLTLTSESRTVRERPDRGVYEHSFLFELPDGYKEGTVRMQAEVNPDTAWRNRSPQELRYDNNQSARVTVVFEEVPQLNVVIYRVSYEVGGTTYIAAFDHATMLADWLRYGYPVSGVRTWLRTFSYGSGLPDCDSVNAILSRKRLWDKLTNWSVPAGARYYGIVDDGGGFMQGCAPAIPAYVSSGPAGAPPGPLLSAWDTDASYGDWYGAHELGHDYGRGHANFCRNCSGGPPYPYPNGDISPSTVGKTALYGLNGLTLDIYPPTWKDLMSYCDFMWVSDFTYEGLMSYLQTSSLSAAPAETGPLLERLLLVGTINLDTNQVNLQPLAVVPAAPDIEPRQPGPYAIVLRGPGGELARYPFTPTEVAWGRPAPGAPADNPRLLAFEELLPYVASTTRVEVVGPAGTPLLTVNAGPAAPAVSVTQPLAGQTLSGATVTVAWTAHDPDGDPLLFDVQYSPDNGATWELVAQAVDGPPLLLETANLVRSTGETGLFRVWASDGIHSAYGDSGAFTVPNHPPTVSILPPAGGISTTVGIVIAAGQTLTLGGNAYDADLGTLPAELLTWTSDLQGPLGEGPTISTASLLPGTHIITVRADDAVGSVATQEITVTVVGDPSQLPQPPDGLRVSPKLVLLDPQAGANSQALAVENHNSARSIRWSATTSAPWLSLSLSAGHTPADTTLSYNGRSLPVGTYTTTVTFQSPDVPHQRVEVPVFLTISRQLLYLPVIMRRLNPASPPTPRPTSSPSETPLPTQTFTPAPTRTPTVTRTASPSPTASPTVTLTPTPLPTATRTPTASPTASSTTSPTTTETQTLVHTPTTSPSATPTHTRTATPSQTPSTDGIYGRVTYNGQPAAGLTLWLRFWNGTAWSERATVTTAADGSYHFLEVPSLTAGQTYHVLYANRPDAPNPGPGYLWSWYANAITDYVSGSTLAGGDFDVADIAFVSPADGATVTLPAQFCWTRRSATDDNYRLLFYNSVADEVAATGYLGYENCVTVSGLPSNWPSGGTYTWWVRAYQGTNPDNTPYNYGDAYGERDVIVRYGAPAERAGEQ